MANANVLACALIILGLCSARESVAGVAEVDERGRTHYYGFEIMRITGLHEAEIEKYGCQYGIDRNDFRRTLSPLPKDKAVKYDAQDVRAKVVFGDAIYFVDRHGVVKGPDGYATIDKAGFVKSLELIGECKS